MNDTIQISIIMPVYNVEQYLSDAIDSILNQSFRDWELILVNDASTDSSEKICRKYSHQDKRIHIFSKPFNEGLAAARNTGMAHASGQWILFMDSDDRIAKESFSRLMEHLEISSVPDILVFGYTQEYTDKKGNIKRSITLSPNIPNLRSIGDVAIMLDYQKLFSYAWNKLYRKEFILQNSLSFENTKMIEDFLFNIQAFTAARNIICINESYYRYRKPPHVTLASQYIDDFHLLCLRRRSEEKKLLDFWNVATPQNILFLNQIHIKHIFSSLVRVCHNQNFSLKDQFLKIKEILDHKEIHESLICYPAQPIRYRVLSMIMYNKKYYITFFIARSYVVWSTLWKN